MKEELERSEEVKSEEKVEKKKQSRKKRGGDLKVGREGVKNVKLTKKNKQE